MVHRIRPMLTTGAEGAAHHGEGNYPRAMSPIIPHNHNHGKVYDNSPRCRPADSTTGDPRQEGNIVPTSADQQRTDWINNRAAKIKAVDGKEWASAVEQAADEYDEQHRGHEDRGEQTGQDDAAPASAAVQLVRIAEAEYHIGQSESGEPFAYTAAAPHIALLFRGNRNGLRSKLALRFFRETGRTAPQQALADALLALEGMAADYEREPLHIRIGSDDQAVYLDVGNAQNTVIRIADGAWSLEATAPVKFHRTALTTALPTPAADHRAADVPDLFEHLNIDPHDHRVILGYLVACLIAPNVPHPVLALLAEQGAAKSTATSRLVSLVDPSSVPLRKAPSGEDAWVTAAAGSWVVGLDNLSGIAPWLSDALCRAVTGDGDVRRRLYTDGDLSVIRFRRCIIANGITLGGLRGDLADRIVAADLHTIDEANRRDEEEMEQAWQQVYPTLFGNLLDFAAQVSERLPSVQLDRKPRMADFARILKATDEIADDLGILTTANGLDRYLDRARRLAEDSLDSDEFITGVLALVRADTCSVARTSAELLADVETMHRDEDGDWKRPRMGWPRSPRAVTDKLKRNVPQMRKIGMTVTEDSNRTNTKTWTVTPATRERADSSPATPATPENHPITAGERTFPAAGVTAGDVQVSDPAPQVSPAPTTPNLHQTCTTPASTPAPQNPSSPAQKPPKTPLAGVAGQKTGLSLLDTPFAGVVRDYIHAAGKIGRGHGELGALAKKHAYTAMDAWGIADADSTITYLQKTSRYYKVDAA